MNVGISSACFYPMTIEKSLEKELNLGFKDFEFFINTDSELKSYFVKELKKMMDDKGAKALSVHPFSAGYESFMLFSGYERRFVDTLEYYRHFFEACNILGANIFVMHGDRNMQISEEKYMDLFYKVIECGSRYGVTVAQENVTGFRSQSPDFIKRFKAQLGSDIKFVFDIKQSVRAGVDPFETLYAMGENLVHIHFNDNSKEKHCLLPGEGKFDYDKVKSHLDKIKYKGNSIIEVYSGDISSDEALVKSFNFLKEKFK